MTRAQTRFAYKLKKYILAEPTHIHMGYFHFDIDEYIRGTGGSVSTGLIGKTCGTVGCIGGSACFLKVGKGWADMDAEHIGAKALGLNESQAGALFFFPFDRPEETSPADWALYTSERRKLKSRTPGTQEYANVVADALQNAIDAYGFQGRL